MVTANMLSTIMQKLIVTIEQQYCFSAHYCVFHFFISWQFSVEMLLFFFSLPSKNLMEGIQKIM